MSAPHSSLFAAVLAGAAVAGVQVAAVELDLLSRQAVVAEQPDDLWHRDLEAGGADPGVGVGLELPLQVSDLGPALEVVVDVVPVLDGDDLGRLLAQHGEGPPRADHANRRVQAIENEHFFIQHDRQGSHTILRVLPT